MSDEKSIKDAAIVFADGVFKSRSKVKRTEVHLSEAELAGIIAASIMTYAEVRGWIASDVPRCVHCSDGSCAICQWEAKRRSARCLSCGVNIPSGAVACAICGVNQREGSK